MANLLEETLHMLKANGKTVTDIQFCTIQDKWFPWNQFIELANFEYDEGYGGHEIDESLMVVGDNWWLERHEYDGSEWWEYKERPDKDKMDRATSISLKVD